MHYIRSLTVIIIYYTIYTQLTNQIYYFTWFPEKTHLLYASAV